MNPTGSISRVKTWKAAFNQTTETVWNSCTQLESVSGDEVAIEIYSVSLFVLPADKSALMFEYLNERENVNIFSQTFWVGLHAVKVSKAHCCLNEWLLTDLWRHENHMFFESLVHQQMWSSLMVAFELILMSLSIKGSDSLQINP